MNSVLFVLILTYFLYTCQAAEWMSNYYNKDFPGKCAITDQLIIDEGVCIKDPQHACRQIVCGFNGSVVFQSCGAVSGLPEYCRFGSYIDVTQPYPHCCVKNVICNPNLVT